MPANHCLEQLKSAKVIAFQAIKKKKCEVNQITDSTQLEINNNKLSTTNISNTNGESKTRY